MRSIRINLLKKAARYYRDTSVTIILVTVIGLILLPFAGYLSLIIAIILLGSISFYSLGILARLALGAFVYATIGAVVMEATSLAGVKMNFSLYLAILLIVSSCYAITNKDRINFRTSVNDLLGFAVWLSVFIFLTAPFFNASTSKILESLIPGEDNNSHFQMYRYVLNDKHYAYSNPVNNAGIRPSLLSYAQGGHAAMAVVTAPFVESSSTYSQLRAFVYSAAAVFSMIFWFLFLTVIKPLAKLKDIQGKILIGLLLACGYTILVPLGLFISMYTYGFYAQNFAYLCLALLLVVLVEAVSVRRNKLSRPLVTSAVMLIIFYGLFSSWYLLAPVALPIFLVYAWSIRDILRRSRPILILIALAVLACLYLAYIYLFTSPDGAGHLFTPGGVYRMHARTLLVAIPVAILTLNYFKHRKLYLASIAMCCLIAVAMSLLIGILQLKKEGHFDYYFYKSIFTVTFLSIGFYGYEIINKLMILYGDGESRKPTTGHSFMLPGVGLLVTIAFLVTYNLPIFMRSFIDTNYTISQHQPVRLLDVYTNPRVLSQFSDVITLDSCNPYTDFTGTIWAGAFFLPYNRQRENLENSLKGSTYDSNFLTTRLLNEIKAYADTKSKPVAIVLGDVYCINPDKNNVVAYFRGDKKVALIDVHGSPYK